MGGVWWRPEPCRCLISHFLSCLDASVPASSSLHVARLVRDLTVSLLVHRWVLDIRLTGLRRDCYATVLHRQCDYSLVRCGAGLPSSVFFGVTATQDFLAEILLYG